MVSQQVFSESKLLVTALLTQSPSLKVNIYRDICKRFNLTTGKAPQTPMPHRLDLSVLPDEDKLTDMTESRSKVGALMYAAHCVRSDACGPVQQFSRYLHPAMPAMLTHLNNALTYDGKKPGPVYGYSYGYSDADLAGDVTTRRLQRPRVWENNQFVLKIRRTTQALGILLFSALKSTISEVRRGWPGFSIFPNRKVDWTLRYLWLHIYA